jgi:hypothetical protein
MRRPLFVLLTLAGAAALCWQGIPASVTAGESGIWDPCSSTATASGGCLVACPQGDGPTLEEVGSVIHIVVENILQPIPGIPASDIWLLGCGGTLNLCGGSGSINADSATNAEGMTTISGSLSAGGCELNGLSVVVQGVVFVEPCWGADLLCLPITTVSPDIDANNVIDLLDFSAFAGSYPSPPKTLDSCSDFDCSGTINLIDFSIFSSHYLHQC